jgi:hypothetical protein
MSHLPGNPHFDEGDYYNGSENYNLAQATMALAYEQRTANLIALWIDPNANESPLNGLDYGGIAQQIKERLGLA